MAEARQAADLYHLQKRHLGTRNEGYYTFTLSVPTLGTFVSQVGLFTHRLKYSLLNRLWPASPLTLVGVMSGVTYVTVNAKGESWVRSGWLAEALWRMDTTMGRLNPLHASYPTEFRVGYLAAVASFTGMLLIVSLERLTLRLLLNWQGWLFGRGNKVLTTAWGAAVTLLSGKKNLTYAFHMSLPTLPLPSLKHTCSRFLDSVHPLMSAEEFAETTALAQTFMRDQGPVLQRYLWLRWLTTSNYLLEWWENYVYLAGRTPIMVNSNYYCLDSKLRPTTNQLERAAGLVHAMLTFKDQVESEQLEPMTIRGMIPLCMSQYKRMFGTTRIPGRDMDELQHVPYSRYIVVCCKGFYYKLNVYHGARGTLLTPYSSEEIRVQLDAIKTHAHRQARELPADRKPPAAGSSGMRRGHRIQSFEDLVVLDQLRSQQQGGALSHSASSQSFNQAVRGSAGASASGTRQSRRGTNLAAFTGGPRSRWAEVREVYFAEGMNRKSLDTIEKSAFLLHLEDRHFTTTTERALSVFCQSSAWYDKSINLFVFDDGYAALNCEHSWADAPAIAHMWEYSMLYDHILAQRKKPRGAAPTLQSADSEAEDADAPALLPADREAAAAAAATLARDLPVPTMLKFEIDDELTVAANQAQAFVQELASDVDLQVVEHLEYGKGFIKKARCSPDGFVQMALQLTYWRMYGKFDLVYESSMTRLFRLGRTETTRSLTDASAAFVHAMEGNGADKPKQSAEESVRLLRRACTLHADQNKMCMAGQGIDRHLFALYVCARGLSVESEFLKRALSLPWRLSTSQQPQDQTDLRKHLPEHVVQRFMSPGGGFGPVADDGYGVSYMFAGENAFFFHISSKKSAPETSSARFADALMQALDDMASLFDKDPASRNQF